MPTLFPCPNTQCNYQFDAEVLPPAAMVTCPLCRTRFPYRAQRTVPAATGPAPAPTDEPRPSGARVVQLRDLPKGGGVLMTLALVVGFTVVLIGLLAMLTVRGRTPSDPSRDAADERFNLKVEAFPPGWTGDATHSDKLQANVVVRKRSNPDGWVALAAQDFTDREPRPAEVEELLRVRLRRAVSGLAAVPIEGERWSGRDTVGIQFSGDLGDGQVRGEGYAMTYKGIVYVFIAWASEADWAALREELTGLREKVKPAGFRENWAPKRATVETFEGDGYQIEDADGVWLLGKPEDEWKPGEKRRFVVDDVKSFDPAATMVLQAVYQIKERDDSKRHPAETTALVVELPGGGDPLEAARAHVVARIKKDYTSTPPEVNLEPLAKSPSGTPLPTGGPAIGRFLFKDPSDMTPDGRWIWVISAITVGGKTVAVEAKVKEKFASYVEEWMVHLAGSLKAK
ncbi:MAG TPA: hypothetical protein VKE40_06630 [Gemmataceae bacterium]|nr:hypothetical protein [Gemmataceae bacterium]